MDDLHAALARALKAPMARWWRRSGALWLTLMLVPIVLQLYALWLLPELSPFHNSGHPLFDRDVAQGFNLITYAFAVLTWLMAGLRVNRILNDYLDLHPLPYNPQLLLTRLRLSVLYGWPVLLTLCLTFRLSWYVVLPPEGWTPSLSKFSAWVAGFEAATGLAVTMLWVLALLAATPRRPLLPVVLAVCMGMLPMLSSQLSNMRGVLLEGIYLDPSDGGFPQWGSSVAWAFGLCFAALCLLSLLARRQLLAWSLALLLALGALASLLVSYLPYWYVVPYSMSFLGGLASFSYIPLAMSMPHGESAQLLRVMLPIPVTLAIPQALFWLALLLNAAYVVLHFAAIQRLFQLHASATARPPLPVRGMLAPAGDT